MTRPRQKSSKSSRRLGIFVCAVLAWAAWIPAAAQAGVGASITNTATVSHDIPFVPREDSATVDVVVEADLALEAIGLPNPVFDGTTLLVVFRVTNNGPANSTGSLVTADIPGDVSFVSSDLCFDNSGVLTCEMSALGPGEEEIADTVASFGIDVASPIVFQGTLAGQETDPVPANDTSTLSVPVELAMFYDGFESGDTAGWSLAVP